MRKGIISKEELLVEIKRLKVRRQMKRIGDVVCSIIERDGKFLLAQRSAEASLALKWEFPGGKVKKGESEQNAQTDVKLGLLPEHRNGFHF